jgi:hypothetical protein
MEGLVFGAVEIAGKSPLLWWSCLPDNHRNVLSLIEQVLPHLQKAITMVNSQGHLRRLELWMG